MNAEGLSAHNSKSFLRWIIPNPFSSIGGKGVGGALESIPPGRDWSNGPPVRRTPLYVAGGGPNAKATHNHLPDLSDPSLEIGSDLHTMLVNQQTAKRRKPKLIRWWDNVKLSFAVALQVTRLVVFTFPVVILFILAIKMPNRVEFRTACIALQKLLIRLGPTYIKLGQWMGTRRDIFPKEICHHLSTLCDKAPAHSWEHSEMELTRQTLANGEKLIDFFESVDRQPINSGSVAQVHHAILKKSCDGLPAGTHLALKILHPNVRERLWVDVWVLKLFAQSLEFFSADARFADPMVHWYEFSSLLLSQLNFEREADNMDQFQYNFRNIPQVVFPTALRSLTNADVLVETFELGWKMDDIAITKNMADLGVRMFLKMIFEDNFLHADLHTGNILLRRRSIKDGTITNDLSEGSDKTHVNEIVVLDPGLVTTLSPHDRETVLMTFAAVACADSDLTAEIALARSPCNGCTDVAEFKKDVGKIFEMLAPNYKDPIAWARTGFKMGDIQIGDVMMDTLERMKKHHVSIDGHFASLMTALVVGEAMGKKMNPQYNMFSAAAPYLMTALDSTDLKYLVTKLKEVYGKTAVVS